LVVKSQFPSDLFMLMYCQFEFPEPPFIVRMSSSKVLSIGIDTKKNNNIGTAHQ